DEGKPRCQRCVDSDFECHYPSGLTFLDKNALTVSSSGNLADSSSVTYRRLQVKHPPCSRSIPHSDIGRQFVDQCLPRSRPRKRTHIGSPVPQRVSPVLSSQEHSHRPTPSHSTWPFVLPPPRDSATGDDDELLAWAAVAPEPATDSLPELPDRELERPADVTPSDDYETALHVLLSLGTDSPRLSRDTAPGQSHAGAGVRATNSAAADIQISEPRSPSSSTSAGPQRPVASTHSVADKAVRESQLRLLRHYRYEVSPWLDICDLDQAFGLCVPHMATESEIILQALVQLSAAALNAEAEANELHNRLLLAPERMSTESSPSSKIIAETLMFVHDFITSASIYWQSPLVNFEAATACDRLHVLSPRVGRCISFLLLRLDLAAALKADQTSSVRGPLVDALLQWNPSSWEEDMFYQASKPFLLCARLLSFCSMESTPSSPASFIPWRAVAEELNAWYMNRPQEFQPMVELEHDCNNERRLFPAILFSSGAAIFANQFYHTAMLILLQRKPRTTLLGIRSSSLLSPLWHVQRICGTALNNDRRECWDPCLAASLHLAARGITYEPQQREVLRAFKSIEALTSWDMGYFSTDLHVRWGLESE
ncbi:hypothetical protein C8A03DRAFT_18972, partial [Achaetomium macrosporum]